MRKKYTLLIVLGYLSVMASVSAVWAATGGAIPIQSTVSLPVGLSAPKLDITNVAIDHIRPGEQAEANGETLSCHMNLVKPGDSRVIRFNIKNTGGIPAKMLEAEESPYNHGLLVTWSEPGGRIIQPGESVSCFMTVAWIERTGDTQTVNLSGSLQYVAA